MADGDAGTSGTEGNSGGETTFTQAQLDSAVQDALAGAKSKDDVAFQNLWKEGKEAKAALKAFEGLDAKAARDAMTRLKEIETEGKAGEVGVTSDQLKAIRAEVVESLEGEYTPFKTENETLKSQIRTLQLDNVIKGVMAKQGVRPERIDALFRLNSDKFDLTDDGEPMVKDRAGMDVGKFVSETLGDEWPDFFLASGSSGGGASRSNAGGGGRTRTVDRGDKASYMGNLEAIAKGEVTVTD